MGIRKTYPHAKQYRKGHVNECHTTLVKNPF